MAEHVLRVHINLVAIRDAALRELQRLVDILRYHRSASAGHSQDRFAGHFEFFSLQPSQNTAMDFSTARAAADSWVLLHVLRDAIDVVNAFLESVFHACSLYSFARDETVSVEAFNGIPQKRKAFHRLGLPKKIDRLRDEFAVESDFDAHIVSLNEARNCLVHRLGVVTNEEIKDGSAFIVRWMALWVEGRSPDGTETVRVDGPREFPAGWTVACVTGPEERRYQLGDRIALDYDQLLGAIFSHQNYINNLVAAVEAYARRLGIPFSTN